MSSDKSDGGSPPEDTKVKREVPEGEAGEKAEAEVEKKSPVEAEAEAGAPSGEDQEEENGDASDAEMDVEESNKESEQTPNSQVDPIYEQNLMKPLFERRDKSLKELLDAMDEFSPIIPDAVIDYYLTKSGFKSQDHRIKRLLALATQKFVADIANDAYQFSKIRAQSANAAGGAGRGRAGPGSMSGRTVLTMESLSGVLGDYGINANRPDFYR